MAFSPPLLVQESAIDERRSSGRADSLHAPYLYQPYKVPMAPQGPSYPSRMSMSPVKMVQNSSETPRPSPKSKDQKQVTFELLLPLTQARARLPMRVMISKHDNTDSIITTVKNFYGLYDGPGVSFQDGRGNILIAAYENFQNGMTVFVKVADEPMIASREVTSATVSPKKPKLGPPIEMRPPSQGRKKSFNDLTRSPSPVSLKSHHSSSTITGGKKRAQSQKSMENGMLGDAGDIYSDSDGGNGSVTSSKRCKAEPHASAEISVENILEGGRRKRAIFESSKLPLFVPPQVPVPNSVSSVSPQRRATNGDAASPVPFNAQRTFLYNQPLPSPQSYGRSDVYPGGSGSVSGVYGQALPYLGGQQVRGRPAVSYQAPRRVGSGILPTPEPTVGTGSVISDEDVAIQLMRLGDASNMSHGRTSTSTLDDALSGKADAASSGEESEEDDEDIVLPAPRYPIQPSHSEGPRRKKQRYDGVHSDSVDSDGDDYKDESFKGDSDQIMPEDDADRDRRRMSKSVPRPSMSSANGVKAKSSKTKVKSLNSPASASAGPSRKTSLGSTAQVLGPDEEDLSSKPRCQRCRKSKKGCDRQRPCGRCKDAGIGADGCISEDEGNGRRGRFGRHMGVTIKKDADGATPQMMSASPALLPVGTFLTPALPIDKNKKRKRST